MRGRSEDSLVRAKRPPRYAGARFRHDEEHGWHVVGTDAYVHVGVVKVHRKNGTTKTVTVRRLGKPFESHGFVFVPGYLRE